MNLDLRAYVRDVPDFPKPGILFKDITPLLHNERAFHQTVEQMAAPFRHSGATRVAAIESRGFIFGGAIAALLGCGFVPLRKPGKLPWKRRRHDYALEYGSDALEVHDDALTRDDRILIVDDVLATGGTASAAVALMQHFNAQVIGISVVIELAFLGGRHKLDSVPLTALIRYE